MARTDLLALTDDGLVQLANAGLVKRAQREVAAGLGPALEDLADGTVTARFADGTETRLMPGQALADARCTCPSSGVCRHRVMLVMAYRAGCAPDRAGFAPEATPPDAERWNPASLDLDGFEARLRPAAKAELARLLASSHRVRLDHGRTPSAHMPMATVRFLVPDDVSYARCDCVQAQGCVHVALAIRAFRAANGADEAVVGDVAPARVDDTERLRLACGQLVERLLALGVTAGMAAHVQPLALAREQAVALGAAQALLAIEVLSEQIESYEARSARYDEGVVLRLAAELCARTRATDRAGALGLGEPFETEMTKSRLVSLGARLRQEGADVRASVLLADSDTGATAMLEKLFSPAPGESDRFGASLPRRQMASGLPLLGVGRGQVLTSVARRRADGLLAFGSGAGGRTQVMPREGIFAFAAPLAARSVAEVADALARRPLSLLRPRRRIDEVHIFDVEEVLGQSWSAGSQVWQAAVRLKEDGGVLHLERAFDAGAKGAIAVLTAALDGKLGPLRQVTGPVRLDRGALVCEPWSLAADRFIVPDLDAVEPEGSGAVFAAEAAPALLDEVERLLSGAVHAGSRAQGGTTHRLAAGLAARLEAEGYRMLAARLRGWLASAADAALFADAAIWLLALRESSEAGVPG
jgi:SWIM zinc finger